MAISKRLRFEILRRDNHTCRYCGATPPGVRLVVDHVAPEALGGQTVPENLATSCEPCNSGKTSTTLDAPVVAQVAGDAIRWAAAMNAAADAMLNERKAREAELDKFLDAWNAGRTFVRLPDDWEGSVLRFRAAGLPLEFLLDAARKAHANRKISTADTFRYMCGISWNMVAELQRAARELVGAESADEVLSDRDQLADSIFGIVKEFYPDISAEALENSYTELTEPAEERSVPGEQSIHVLAAGSAVINLALHLQHFEILVDRGFRRLSLADQAEVEDRLERDLNCAGEEGASEIERAMHRMRHIFSLAEREEGNQ